MLGDDLDVGEHRHEVRVAVPARHDVDVAVVEDARARDPADVPADVEPLGGEHGAQRRDPLDREPMHLRRLGLLQRVEPRPVAVRRHHQVAGCVGELVEEHEGQLAAVDDELRLVLRQRGRAAEDAVVGVVRVLDVLEPPRRPELLHLTEATSGSAL